MTYRKTEAITIYQRHYSESSQIITFYTADFGKIVLLARGIQRQKKRNLNPPDLFSHSEIVFLERSPQSINLLTEITIKDNFASLRTDLAKLRRTFYVAEFLNEMTDQREPNRELFDLALNTLLELAAEEIKPRNTKRRLIAKDGIREETVLFSFEAQALKFLGYMPNTFCCVHCGKPAENRRVAFSFRSGSIICPECGIREYPKAPPQAGRLPSYNVALSRACLTGRQARGNDLIGVSAGAMKLMHILGNPFLPDIGRLKITRQMQMELRRFINKYIRYITGKEFKTLKAK